MGSHSWDVVPISVTGETRGGTTTNMSLKDKIKTFSHVTENEEEVREKQRKKASFAAKLNKFSSSQDGQKNSNTETKKMVQRFNSWEGQEERDKEAKIRKEEFEKTAGMFKEGEVVT